MKLEDLREKLKTEIEDADWSMLKTHHDNGAVFIVDQSIELADAGAAIALDKSEIVKLWMDDNQFYRPGESLIKELEADKFKKCAEFIIIQPYVLIRLKPEFTSN